MTMPKKLIEVALPLEAINAESAREKSIRHGHPSTLHFWWARRPLAAARAVIWSSLVDDPSSHPELFPTEEEQEKERQRLHTLLAQLVKWKTPRMRKYWKRPVRKSENTWAMNPSLFLTRSPGEALSRWRRSVLVWRLTPTI